ncbi:MAG: heme exporter protein CcmB [Pseudomonadota bacterium]
MNILLTLLKTEFLQLCRQKGSYLALLSFALLTLLVFTIAAGPNVTFFPVLLWVIILFVSSLMVSQLFETDLKNGTLEQLYELEINFEWVMLVKTCVHCLIVLTQASILLMLCAIMFHVKQLVIFVVFASFLLGVPGMSALAVLSSTIVLGMRSHQLVTSVLVFPLLIPPLIFACGAIVAAQQDVCPNNALWLLFACSLFAVPVNLFAGAFALKAAVQND